MIHIHKTTTVTTAIAAKYAEKLGAISRDVKVSYKVPYSGEYYILDGENKENITDRVIVEHEGGAEDNMKISQ